MTTPRMLAGRYEIGETLGFGGMSEVHRSRDTVLGRDVAVKIMRPELARDETFYQRFRREAQNSASLNHPSIVAIYDTGEEHTPDGDLPFIVMELVEGDTIRDIVRMDGPMELRRALGVMADVCGAIDFSHRKGIIHRDVKPANIMISRDGGVKVMDFGIARAISDSTSTLTQTSSVLGTAQYLSPEQARGESVDPRSDLYSAGCVLYEMVAGVPPFTGESPVAVAYQHVREDPAPPSTVNPEIDRYVDAVVMQAMAKNPENRYSTAADMRSDLLTVLSGGRPSAPLVLSDDELDDELRPDADHGFRGAGYGSTRPGWGSASDAPTEAHPLPGLGKAGAAGLGAAGLGAAGLGAAGLGAAAAGSGAAGSGASGAGAGGSGAGGSGAASSVGAGPGAGGSGAGGSGAAGSGAGTGASGAAGSGWGTSGSGSGRGGGTAGSGTPGAGATGPDRGPSGTGSHAAAHTGAHAAHRGSSVNRRDGERRRPRPVVIAAAVLLVLATIAGAAVWIATSGDDTQVEVQEVTIPEVAQRPVDEVINQLTGLGLEPVQHPRPDPQIPEGVVVSSDPIAGKRLPRGSEIHLVVSTGKPILSVPNVMGMAPADARRTLEEAGFQVEPENAAKPSTEEDQDKVVGTDPGPGAQVPSDRPVRLTVGSGPEQVSVPGVVGQDVESARAALESAGFRVDTVQVDGTEREGQVTGQSTPAGQSQLKGATITVQVSAGNRFLMPNLVNRTVDDALEELRRAGWKGTRAQLVELPQNDPDLGRVGRIFSQQPPVGEAGVNDQVVVRVIRFGLVPGPG